MMRFPAVAALLATAATVCAAAVPPAERVVTLAPHLAELAFAAGAGSSLVGVSAHTDYPEAARSLPVVGDAFMLDQERLALLRPDLLLAWQSGTPAHVVDALRGRGYRVVVIRTRGLPDVATALRRIGALTGQAAAAGRAAARYEQELLELRNQWRDAAPIRVFYQVSQRPLYTVNGEHYVSELIGLCGGRNVFADLGELAPLVAEEAVLGRDPEVLLAAAVPGSEPFTVWERWPALSANRYGNRFLVAGCRDRPRDAAAPGGGACGLQPAGHGAATARGLRPRPVACIAWQTPDPDRS
ncbi:MAG: helical backbone metal receptor [Woeseiaceae bacterium]|nr:helical backbone metal receptor [Woeseiaceae bacterium]